MKDKKRILKLIGSGVGIISIGLGWFWFGWELPVIMYLALFGNNLEQKYNN